MASSVIVLKPRDTSSYEFDHNDDIQIYLTTSGPNSSVIPLKIYTGDTIASVKMRIQSRQGFYVKHQKLVYAGRELHRQDALVRDYGLTDGEQVHLVVKLSELKVVTIRTFSGKEHVFRIDKMKSIRDLKNRLSMRAGLTADQQQLVYRGKDLKDDMLIEQLSVSDDAIVHLFLHTTVKLRSQVIGSEVELSATAQEIKTKPFVVEEVPSDKYRHLTCRDDDNVCKCYPRKAFAHVEGISSHTIPSVLNDLMWRVKSGLENGHAPILSPEGSGGAYFMQDEFGSSIVGVFKPVDEEPMAANNPRGLPESMNGEGLKRGTKVGEGALREVAAYILDHAQNGQNGEKFTGFAGVPPTILIRCSYEYSKHHEDNGTNVNVKIGSLQMYVHASSNCEDMGPAQFPVREVHKIAVLDIRLANTDRNGANILACKQGDSTGWTLVPIDHGYCLPDKFEDCTFEWLYWPQAKLPFQRETLEYIAELDAEADIALLERHGWTMSQPCAQVLRIGTMLLKRGAAAGLTPYEIGSMMCRETLRKVSMIEEIIKDAQSMVSSGSSGSQFLAVLPSVMDKYIQAMALRIQREY